MSFINWWHYYFSMQFLTVEYLSNIFRLSPHPAEQSEVPISWEVRVQHITGQCGAVTHSLSHSQAGPQPGTRVSLTLVFLSQTTCRSAQAGSRLSHNAVMDLDTFCIKFWANGCIVSYDILVTGEPGRAKNNSIKFQSGTNQSSNRVLTSATAMLADIRYSSPLLSSSLCNCILFIWCRSQPSTDWYRELLLLLYTQAQSSSKWRSGASFFIQCIAGRTKIM